MKYPIENLGLLRIHGQFPRLYVNYLYLSSYQPDHHLAGVMDGTKVISPIIEVSNSELLHRKDLLSLTLELLEVAFANEKK